VLGVRWRGVRAAANGRVPCPGWPGRGAVTAVCQPATAAVIAARISSSSTGVGDRYDALLAALAVAQVGGGAVEDGSGLAG
jgi:hypothetical protein